MPLPISLPYTFANATTAIPLSNLDADLTTLRDGINGIGNGTNALANVSITGGTITGLTSPLPPASGGTGVISAGTNGNVLTSNGTAWVSQAPAGGGNGVASISFGTTGLTPNTATTGIVSVAGTLVAANGGTGITSPGTAGNVLTSTGTAWVSQAASGGLANVQTFDASGTWTKPAGYAAGSRVLVQVWGAGGSGAKTASTGTTGGGGGGGGAYVELFFALSTLGATETVTIGAGGTAITAATTNGNAGGNTTFGSLLTGYGGARGIATGGTGGGGGGQFSQGAAAGSTSGSPWDFLSDGTGGGIGWGGSSGANGFPGFFGGGGGGGGKNGTNVAGSAGGAAYNGGAGGGGAGQGTGAAGAGGASIGGGNGGASSATGTAGSGAQPGGGGGGTGGGTSGAGGAGRVIVTVFPA